MKKFLLFLFTSLLFTSITKAQSDTIPKNEKGECEYSAVVPVEKTTAQTLYSRAKMSIAKTFVSAKDVTQLADDDAKSLVIKGNIPIKDKGGNYGNVSMVVTIQCKDDKYRYVISDLVHSAPITKQEITGGSLEREKPACGTFFLSKKQWNHIKSSANEQILGFLATLEKSMKSTGSDW